MEITNFKITICDNHCTYEYDLPLSNRTCIDDIAQKIYEIHNLEFKEGTQIK